MKRRTHRAITRQAITHRAITHWALMAAIGLAGCGGDDENSGPECGEGTIEQDGLCVFDRETAQAELAPQVDGISITELDVPGGIAPLYTLHAIDVAVKFAVDGEAFEADILVGLQTPDGTDGCTLGSMRMRHDPPLTGEDGVEPIIPDHAFTREFIIPPACSVLEERDDLEVFVSFDPWHTVNLDGRAPLDRRAPPNGSEEFFDFAKASEVGIAEDCVGDLDGAGAADCRTALELLANPGPDIEIQRLTFDNAVAILEIPVGEYPAHTLADALAANEAAGIPVDGEVGDGTTVIPAARVDLATVPNLKVSTMFRVLGIEEDEAVGNDQVDLEILIRPLAGGIGTEVLPEDDFEWRPLHERHQVRGPDGEFIIEETERSDVEHIVGPESHGLTEAVFIANDTYATMVTGEWSQIQEFEVSVCFESEFGEAMFEGEMDPLDNNCATLPIIVLRRYATQIGAADPADGLGDGGANTWSNDKNYAQTWGDLESGRTSVSAWLTMGHTKTSASFGLGGSRINNPGGWYEAGTESEACVFGECLTIAKAIATLRDRSSGVDNMIIEGKILVWHFFPRVNFDWPDGTLSLQQLIDLANATQQQAYSTSKSFEKDIVGKDFNTPCGGADASIKAFVEMGIDAGATTIEKAPLAPAVNACGDLPVSDGFCFRSADLQSPQNGYGISDRCRQLYGHHARIAPLRNARDLELIRAAVGPDRWLVTGAFRYLTRYQPQFFFDGVFYREPHTPWAAGQPNGGGLSPIYINPENQAVLGFEYSVASHAACAIPASPSIEGGSRITATITPFIAAGVKAGLGADFGTIAMSIDITLNLLEARIPFVGTLTQGYGTDQRIILSLGRSIQMTLATLSGVITATLKWKTFWTSGQHTKTLLSWDGFDLGSWWILPYRGTNTLL